MFKKIFSIATSITLSIGLLSACSNTTKSDNNDKIKIVSTIFPQYDWMQNIIGEDSENIDHQLLIQNGGDLHNYQPSANDIINISDADLFIYVGGESDAWVDEVLKNATNKDMIVINMLDVLGDSVKEEEIIDGMEEIEHNHEHDEDEHDEDEHDEDEHEHDENAEYDEHIWLSLKNAVVLCNEFEQVISELDVDNADKYKNNTAKYIGELENLDEEYQEMIADAERNVVLFADRFPFRYLVDDYNLEYYAAFPGCSAETEASFETVAFLTEKINTLDLPYIITIDNSSTQIANTIVSNTANKNQEILSVNSLQSITDSDMKKGETYLVIMARNLEIFREALN